MNNESVNSDNMDSEPVNKLKKYAIWLVSVNDGVTTKTEPRCVTCADSRQFVTNIHNVITGYSYLGKTEYMLMMFVRNTHDIYKLTVDELHDIIYKDGIQADNIYPFDALREPPMSNGIYIMISVNV
jgi:hypothetical protein